MIRNVLRSIIVNVAPEKAYAIWSDFESYPKFLPDIQRVALEEGIVLCQVLRDGVVHQWEAEVIELSPHRRIAFHHRNGVERRTVVSIRALDSVQTEVSLGAEFTDGPGEPDYTRDLFDLYLRSFKAFADQTLTPGVESAELPQNQWA